MATSDVQWTRNGDARIAYRVFGDGPVDILMAPGAFLSLEAYSEGVPHQRIVGPLASFARVIMWDLRGVGLSDPVSSPIDAVNRIAADDALAVIAATQAHRPVLFCPDVAPFHASVSLATLDPPPVSKLIVLNSTARIRQAPGYPGPPDEAVDSYVHNVERRWGTQWFADLWGPSLAPDERDCIGRTCRPSPRSTVGTWQTTSPGLPSSSWTEATSTPSRATARPW